MDTRFLPPPLAIGRAFWALAVSGELWRQLAPSLGRLAVGWSVGTVAGDRGGVRRGAERAWARAPGMALVSALFPIPKIALVPLFIIWFGIGEGSKIATLRRSGCSSRQCSTWRPGIDALPRGLVRMGQSFGLGRWAVLRKIVLPGVLPALLSSFRVTASIAIILLVAAEMIGAETGDRGLRAAGGEPLRRGQPDGGVGGAVGCWGWRWPGVVGLLERWLLRLAVRRAWGVPCRAFGNVLALSARTSEKGSSMRRLLMLAA